MVMVGWSLLGPYKMQARVFRLTLLSLQLYRHYYPDNTKGNLTFESTITLPAT